MERIEAHIRLLAPAAPSGGRRTHRKPISGADRLASVRLAEINKVLKLRKSRGNEAAPPGELLMHAASLFIRLDTWPRKFERWARRHLPSIKREELQRLVADTEIAPVGFNPERIGALLALSEIDRARLRVCTITPFDLTAEEREATRKEAKRAKDRKRRERAGATPRSQAASRLKPWQEANISRAKWYRDRAKP